MQPADARQWKFWLKDERALLPEAVQPPGLYFRNELLLMLERIGFRNIVVYGEHSEVAPTSNDDFLVFVATK